MQVYINRNLRERFGIMWDGFQNFISIPDRNRGHYSAFCACFVLHTTCLCGYASGVFRVGKNP